MDNRRVLLLGISLVLAVHALVVGGALGNSLFLITFFCWLWVGAAALRNRLDSARAMCLTMIVVELIAGVAVMLSHAASGMVAFLSLGFLPSLTAWICTLVYVSDMQRREDVSDVVIAGWFEEHEAAMIAVAEQRAAEADGFVEAMTARRFGQDNDKAAARRAYGAGRLTIDQLKRALG